MEEGNTLIIPVGKQEANNSSFSNELQQLPKRKDANEVFTEIEDKYEIYNRKVTKAVVHKQKCKNLGDAAKSSIQLLKGSLL